MFRPRVSYKIRMLLIKRLLTSCVLAFVLSLILLISIGVVIGERGAIHRPPRSESYFLHATGSPARSAVTGKYGAAILLGTLSVSALSALLIAFSQMLPWCRVEPG